MNAIRCNNGGGQRLDTFEIRDEEIDVEEIMRKIRENIRMRREAGIYPEGEIEEISPTRASGSCHPDQIIDAGAGAIGLSPEARRDLVYINSTWDVENKGYFISSHRPVAGRFLIKGRELVHGEVRRVDGLHAMAYRLGAQVGEDDPAFLVGQLYA